MVQSSHQRTAAQHARTAHAHTTQHDDMTRTSEIPLDVSEESSAGRHTALVELKVEVGAKAAFH
jgi:hypothetical protein